MVVRGIDGSGILDGTTGNRPLAPRREAAATAVGMGKYMRWTALSELDHAGFVCRLLSCR